MNKWQIICPVVLLAVVALFMVHEHAVTDSRALAHAVTHHAAGITTLLAAMKTNNGF